MMIIVIEKRFAFNKTCTLVELPRICAFLETINILAAAKIQTNEKY